MHGASQITIDLKLKVGYNTMSQGLSCNVPAATFSSVPQIAGATTPTTLASSTPTATSTMTTRVTATVCSPTYAVPDTTHTTSVHSTNSAQASVKGANVLTYSVCEHGICDDTGVSNAMESEYASRLNYALSAEGLYDSLQKCVKGCDWKPSVASMELNGISRSIQLAKKLSQNTYKPGKLKTVTVTRPKRRECTATSITDRVYQRSLNDNVLYPTIASKLVKGNCACQKGKGTDYARNLLVSYMYKQHRSLQQTDNSSPACHVLVTDIRKYYDTMSHNVSVDMLSEVLSDSEIDHVKSIIKYQYPGTTGFKPGSQLVQILGIFYLNKLDHFIKEQLHIKKYIRYMDDIILIHPSEEYLRTCLDHISVYLEKLGMQINFKKTHILNAYTQRVPFLGFTFQLTATGKVIVRIKSSKFREMKRRLRRLAGYVHEGMLQRTVFYETFKNAYRYLQLKCTSMKYANEYEKLYIQLRKECSI